MNFVKLLLITSLFFSTFAILTAQSFEQKEKDIIFCKGEKIINYNVNPIQQNELKDINVKLTKSNDDLYSLYIQNTRNADTSWKKVMDLLMPRVWTKETGMEIADFYSVESESYYLRMDFNSSYNSLGNGMFLLPQNEEEMKKGLRPYYFQLNNCRGTLE